MADSKQKFVRINTPVGTLQYPHLTSPDTRYVAEGSYHTKFSLPASECDGLIEKLTAVRDEYFDNLSAKDKKTHNKVDAHAPELDEEGEETGNIIFNFKQKAKITSKEGKVWEVQPSLFDSANNKLDPEGLKLWGGSRGRISAEVVPYAMASTKSVGVTLRLKAVQVVEFSSGGGASPFDTFDGGAVVGGKESTDDAEDAPFNTNDDY